MRASAACAARYCHVCCADLIDAPCCGVLSAAAAVLSMLRLAFAVVHVPLASSTAAGVAAAGVSLLPYIL